jgi:hypothetical protein
VGRRWDLVWHRRASGKRPAAGHGESEEDPHDLPFRDEARAAFDWLNRRTDADVRFFAVEVRLVRIANSPPAPVFEVVSRPNNVVRTLQVPATEGSPRVREFIAEVLDRFVARHPAVRSWSNRGDRPYAGFGRGPFGRWSIVTGRRGGALRVEAYLNKRDRAHNKFVFDRMAAERARWDAVIGAPLSWERLDNRDASRIAARYPGPSSWPTRTPGPKPGPGGRRGAGEDVHRHGRTTAGLWRTGEDRAGHRR